MLATYVIETVGTQEYQLGQEHFLERLADAYGAGLASAEIAAPWSSCPARLTGPADPCPRRPAAVPVRLRRDRARTSGEDLVGVGADLAPGTVLRRTRAGCSRWASAPPEHRRSAGGRRTRAASCGPAGLRVSRVAAAVAAALRGPRRHRLRRGRRRLRRPRAAGRLDHARDRRGVHRAARGWAGRTPSRCGRTAGWWAGSTASRSAGCSRGSRCSTARPTRPRRARRRAGRPRGRGRRPAAAGRRPVAHAAPGDAGCDARCRGPQYLRLLADALTAPLPEPFR